ncbi:hypothetical protein IMSAGC014_01446 [Bacteroidaceae bacterium]|nr:hypothetical protein IMSAGC014_01446 [Bacteroidaceae bacterium]
MTTDTIEGKKRTIKNQVDKSVKTTKNQLLE